MCCLLCFTATYDPGWNDPPPMMTGGQPVPKSRLNLNKRVAFPMQSAASTSINTSNVRTADSGLPLPFSTAKHNPAAVPTPNVMTPLAPVDVGPPPQSTSVPPLPNAQATPIVAPIPKPIDVRAYCYEIFANILKSSTAPVDTTKTIEIERRLEVLNQSWLTDGFNEDIENLLHGIAKGNFLYSELYLTAIIAIYIYMKYDFRT